MWGSFVNQQFDHSEKYSNNVIEEICIVTQNPERFTIIIIKETSPCTVF